MHHCLLYNMVRYFLLMLIFFFPLLIKFKEMKMLRCSPSYIPWNTFWHHRSSDSRGKDFAPVHSACVHHFTPITTYWFFLENSYLSYYFRLLSCLEQTRICKKWLSSTVVTWVWPSSWWMICLTLCPHQI